MKKGWRRVFRVWTDARTRVGVEMADIILHKNEVGGYAYNDMQLCITQVERVLKRQIFEDLGDGMKGLFSVTLNALTRMKSTVSVKRTDILRESIEA